MELREEQIENIIDLALDEDIRHGDVTTEVLIPPELQGKASILVKARGVIAGIKIAERVFLKIDSSLKLDILIADGARVKPGDIVAFISGRVANILKGERVAINFLSHLSGIATQTAGYIARTRGLEVSITDTRKTIPGLRQLEKYAVRVGGGQNHRFHLGDAILIKDNHLAALRTMGISLVDVVSKAKQGAPSGIIVEVEVSNVREALEAAKSGADIILLDNMSLGEMRSVVNLVRGQVRTEASGGIKIDNVRPAAMTGVNAISIGALTHSSKALDISLELEP